LNVEKFLHLMLFMIMGLVSPAFILYLFLQLGLSDFSIGKSDNPDDIVFL